MRVATFLPGVWAYLGEEHGLDTVPAAVWTWASCFEWKGEYSCVNASCATPHLLRAREPSFASFIH